MAPDDNVVGHSTSRKTWRDVRERRAQAHRARCASAANRVVDDLHALGVEVVIFGSLADPNAPFRPDSDIDICITDDGGLPFSRIEEIVRMATKPISVDLFTFNDLKPAVQRSVLATGVHHVE